MATRPTQLRVDYKGKAYGGIYSVAGNTLIARIPGVDSRAHAVGERVQAELAREILIAILADADRAGRLR
jgi:hypothetical protein